MTIYLHEESTTNAPIKTPKGGAVIQPNSISMEKVQLENEIAYWRKKCEDHEHTIIMLARIIARAERKEE